LHKTYLKDFLKKPINPRALPRSGCVDISGTSKKAVKSGPAMVRRFRRDGPKGQQIIAKGTYMISLAMQQRRPPGIPTASLSRSLRRACVRPVFSSRPKQLFDDFKRHDPAMSKHCARVRRYPLRLSPQLSLQTQFQICLTRALLQLQQRAGTQFDPALASVFVRRLAHYPSSVKEIRAAQNKPPSFFRFSPSQGDMPWNRVLQLA
jgi:hypothetical protein